MAAVTPDVGTGTTIGFGTVGTEWTWGAVESIEITVNRTLVEVTSLLSTTSRDYMYGKLYDTDIVATVQFDADTAFPATADVNAVKKLIVTFPDGEKWEWADARNPTVNVSVGVEDKMLSTLTFKAKGAVTITVT